jgi:hypothetical protein
MIQIPGKTFLLLTDSKESIPDRLMQQPSPEPDK